MESISHRELRNQSAKVLRAVAAGESYTVTNNGRPVAKIVPIDSPEMGLRCIKPATKRGGFSDLPRTKVAESTQDALDYLKGDR